MISEDLLRWLRQSSQRDTIHSSIHKNLEIVSCTTKENKISIAINLPIIDSWVDHEGFATDAAMSHILETLPGVLSMTIEKRSSVVVSLNITYINKARLGEILSVQLYHDLLQKSEFVYIETELKSKGELVAKGGILSKFTDFNWAEEKI